MLLAAGLLQTDFEICRFTSLLRTGRDDCHTPGQDLRAKAQNGAASHGLSRTPAAKDTIGVEMRGSRRNAAVTSVDAITGNPYNEV